MGSNVDIAKDASPRAPQHGHSSAGLIRQRVCVLGEGSVSRGVMIRCPGTSDPSPNTNCLWVGNDQVTADSLEGTGGMPIAPGESITIPCSNPSLLFVISDADDQDYAWMGI